MRSSRASLNDAPSPVSIRSPASPFTFPPDHHLIITTESRILSWSANGIYDVFKSGSRGICAAKEARDGSGVLAIADSQVVVLHDVREKEGGTYRLKGTDGPVRLLHFATDESKTLYFTTTLQNAVQEFDIPRDILLEPASTHPSPPTVLAISPTNHLLLSASERPSTIYIQNLTLRTKPMLVQPTASRSPVVVASFHPTRPNIFLLGFKDGTLAAYNATKL
ncbi:hypothetical protein K402DRAFT_325034, partial [Aulographum hederae CBS 113979]